MWPWLDQPFVQNTTPKTTDPLIKFIPTRQYRIGGIQRPMRCRDRFDSVRKTGQNIALILNTPL